MMIWNDSDNGKLETRSCIGYYNLACERVKGPGQATSKRGYAFSKIRFNPLLRGAGKANKNKAEVRQIRKNFSNLKAECRRKGTKIDFKGSSPSSGGCFLSREAAERKRVAKRKADEKRREAERKAAAL